MDSLSSVKRRLSASLRAGCALLALTAAVPAPAHAQGGMNIILDTEIEEILRDDVRPVLLAAGLDPKNVKIHLNGDKSLNAGAAAGQNMFFNTGLIQETENPNQLIGVMAHEVGHVAGGHMVRSGEMQSAGMKPFLLSMGLGVLAAVAGAPDAAAALVSSSSYFGTIGALGYSREQESRADQAAATFLDRAGISGKGLVEFFDNFRYEEVFSESRRFPFFQSHPISSDRIERLRRRVEEQPNFNKSDNAQAQYKHDLMKAKLAAFMDPPNLTFAKYKETDTSFPARYARAIAYYKALDTERAVRAIDALIAEQPQNPYLYELKGQVFFEAGKTKESEEPLRRSVELKPDAPLLRILLAQSLLGLNDKARIDDAIAQLDKALSVDKENSVAWRLMAQARDAKGQNGAARLAAAEEHFSNGDMNSARIFAMRARELLEKNTPEWRRATDIVLVSDPSKDDLRAVAGG